MVEYLPSSADTSITISEAQVATSLTITAPAEAVEGETFSVTGFLDRADTGEPIPNQTISIIYDGIAVGSGSTGDDGSYFIMVEIPEPGTWTLSAEFAGASGFAASQAQRSLTIGRGGLLDRIRAWWSNLSNPQKLLALLIIGGGTGAVYMGTKK